MNYRLINKFCYVGAIGSIIVGAMIGIGAIWFEGFLNSNVPQKGLMTTVILFTASALGALVTKLLTVEE